MDATTHPTLGLRSDDSKPAKLSKRGRQTRAGRTRLLNRESLDRRTIVSKVFDRLVDAIHADLGGRDQLSAIELALVEAFAGGAVTLDHLNTQILSGAEIDHAMVAMHAQAISAMVRVAAKLGCARRTRDVTPSLGNLLAADAARQQREQGVRNEQRRREFEQRQREQNGGPREHGD
jgi:hypothetical protein